MLASKSLDQIFLTGLVTKDDFPDLSVYHYPELRRTMIMIMFRKQDVLMDEIMRNLERLDAICEGAKH